MKRTALHAGFTLVEMMIVVAIIGLLASISIPNYVHARQTSLANACIDNLRKIDSAKQQWALEAGKTSSDTPLPANLQPYFGHSLAGTLDGVYCPLVKPAGPLAGYTINTVGEPPMCNQNNPVEHPAQLQ